MELALLYLLITMTMCYILLSNTMPTAIDTETNNSSNAITMTQSTLSVQLNSLQITEQLTCESFKL